MNRMLTFAAALLMCSSAFAGTSPDPTPSREPLTIGTQGPSLTYVVLGDSTAEGVGADYDSGIAVSTTKELAQRFRVTMTNLGVTGARMRDVRESQLPAAERLRPDVVLISVGANDVTHLTRIGSVRSDLRQIVQRLTAANPRVRIVITGAPNVERAPRIPTLLRGLAKFRKTQMNRMFEAETVREHLVFARIAERAKEEIRSDPTLYAGDGFHPNNRGYATWLPVLNEALASATTR